MAMMMNGEIQIAAPREVVWGKLNDPEVLKACIPGWEELKTDDNGFRAVAKIEGRTGFGALQGSCHAQRPQSAEWLQNFR